MVLEAVMLCIDNSAYARDGDLVPSRLAVQEEAAGLIAGAKTSMHQENAVGVLTYGEERVSVHLSPTNDMGAVLSALHGLRCGGDSDFVRGIQIAQLALKHRMNKNQKQRIIAFVGSPIKTAEKQLVTLGKQLKKNNVSLDLISFGEVDHNAQRLKLLNEAVDSNGTSCLLECRAEAGQMLSEVILASSLLRDPETGASLRSVPGVGGDSGPAGGVGAMNEFGVDPNTDPELYMVLQLSLQEEQNRAARLQEQTTPSAGEDARGASEQGGANGASAAAGASSVPTAAQIEMMEDIDDELRQALLLSLQDYSGQPPASEDAEMEAAPAPSDGGEGEKSAADQPSEANEVGEEKREQPADSELAHVLGSLPGVDVSDPRLQEVLREAAGSPGDAEGETEKNNGGS
ncbi:putative 26S proteasome non-ATPase regulatory subunit 4 [Neospora caninum Liverpool]|uniref:26S proteasome non-ATPase regulatory subunit 4,putative n=1 Tax=Neospora caninum (strain Liverpool) TaxID=572307 RepID=F0VK25_NEOCL|nr:putative 26S proteasome non-ATPase regulatory subunit 4 [Neospora caninum Liverpool]CBZ54426.1 putative 26S proteasome non-ATPase regulatory subunit 4 [Neospora caninum Liverpool]CEL69135.1 TPA: 26S proteasome non-ATPase regulatory subunit 4,putative [Neospora caninum Liverpool]|eukprot:XP_003884456.1 putative 26S proteasome non-ATPase regulatory subunit 4 [Neospora caninum Liverpool]